MCTVLVRQKIRDRGVIYVCMYIRIIPIDIRILLSIFTVARNYRQKIAATRTHGTWPAVLQ